MRVLVGCEFSGVVRDAFTARGHYAVSCDPIETERVGMHYRTTLEHFMGDDLARLGWDLLIAFPPCTHLASSGARWFKEKRQQQADAVQFVKWIANLPIGKISIENPIGVLSSQFRKPDQIIQPWQFGHGETKATCLWLKGLPKLQPTNIVEGREGRVWKEAPHPDRWKRRSRTYQGIADAMAEQWGAL